MSLSRLLRTPADERERGAALILVLGITVLVSGLVVAAIAYATGAARQSQRDQTWNAALAAAYAGVEEYESRLAADLTYFSYGNPAAPFSATSTVKLPPAASANPAFGLGPTGTWATVPGSNGQAQFRYEVDSSSFYSDGILRLRSTGRVGQTTRTIVADLKQLGFIDFLYFTDFEVSDPQARNPGSTTNCAIYYPSSRPGCDPIYFGGKDAINGPLHTNDAIQTNGAAKFDGKVTTSYKAPSGKNYVRQSGTDLPVFKESDDPEQIGKIGMPATNSQLRKETRPDLPQEVPNPGCLYTGPTKITFHPDGTMTVVSPWTKHTNPDGAGKAGVAEAKCGTPGDAGLARRSGSDYVGERIPVPANLVVYVQNVPSVSGDVNATSGNRPPYPAWGGSSCATNSNSIGFPYKGSKSSETEVPPFSSAYSCRAGDVFVQGTLKGKATVAAENYVYVTGDIAYTDRGEGGDMLGLVGNNAVWVWNPVNSSEQTLLGDNRRIDAAILSVAHTFMVQNYDKDKGDNRGTLSVWGAIAQKFRGPVGTSSGGAMSTGYAKDYNYDWRFRQTAPPKFLSPVTTTYGVNVWVEVEPAFAADGTARS
ncbi:hypothetical protein GC089_09185 [Cellulomonas sp. JZ18]|uniref:hypothetical protein n=1 Tax=Cellulomonas sp. JZ18 TaxID=2654191 RepID=UPI0012D37755|nr:hypothetical protein [Cellulomonas sp. JZ18]QGQ19372.1 hypothetical protein GC089_09185 [Cellulomonas sp. JZ18]